jgi:hypothetical protein
MFKNTWREHSTKTGLPHRESDRAQRNRPAYPRDSTRALERCTSVRLDDEGGVVVGCGKSGADPCKAGCLARQYEWVKSVLHFRRKFPRGVQRLAAKTQIAYPPGSCISVFPKGKHDGQLPLFEGAVSLHPSARVGIRRVFLLPWTDGSSARRFDADNADRFRRARALGRPRVGCRSSSG